jgi:hypothetical protein
MRRLVFAFLILLAGCKRQPVAPTVIDEPPLLAQTIEMGNLDHAKQLGRGFYAIEDGAWRWTQGKFSVRLRAPLQAGTRGATLVVKGSIPPALIGKLKDVTLTSVVNGVRLRTFHYERAGGVVVRLDVPAKAFPPGSETNPAEVDFVLDKVLPPQPGDQRELGWIVTAIGFERKT